VPRVPRISGRKARAAFERAGWVLSRIHGSHFIMRHPDKRQHLSIPDHRTLKPGLLQDLIKRAGMTIEEFITYL